jgi:photosystem II stability/assembly factor-like uncharacterized protein
MFRENNFTMKKIIYFLLILAVFVSIAGFRGCGYGQGESVWGDFIGSVSIGVYGPISNLPGQSNNNYSVCVGENGTIYTSDGRPPAPWVLRQSGTNRNLNYVKVYKHSDSTIAYAVGKTGTVLYSIDKGHSWINRNIPSVLTNLYGLDYNVGFAPLSPAGEVNVVVCGDSGKVWKSTGSGGSWMWTFYNLGVIRRLNSVAVNSGIFVVVGEKGTIFRSLNSGITWENRSLADTNSLNKVYSIRYDRYCAVGNNGRIYVSTDYGYSWGIRTSGTTHHFRDVIFSGLDSAVAAGDAGTVRCTTNGGVTWFTDSYMNTLTTRNIISFARLDENTVNSVTSNRLPGDAAADSTFFLAVSSVPFLGIEPISNFIAEFFSLKQNFPNPFNPETKIRFDIPAGVKLNENVKLVIYDITGKEIAALFNENLKPGEYEAEWNASGYPSGVYFYKLITSGFVKTRKMILIK